MLTETNSEINQLSNEVQEIISNKPHWFLRYGIMLLLLIISCFIATLYYFYGSLFFIQNSK